VLDVDVACPLVGGFDEDLVHQLDDGCLLRLLGQLAVVRFDPFQKLDVIPLLDQGLNGLAADAEVVLDEPGDLARAAENGMDLKTRQRLQLVQGVDVIGVRRRHHEHPIVA
jgi:hypothetical protein